jgi:hypothetical protein
MELYRANIPTAAGGGGGLGQAVARRPSAGGQGDVTARDCCRTVTVTERRTRTQVAPYLAVKVKS